jgi:cellulose biosynthesis protein BcsQ
VLKDVEKRRGNCKAFVLITRKNSTKQHNDYHTRIKELLQRAESKVGLFDTIIPESASFPQALQMIEAEYPTYIQKYKKVNRILADLAEELEWRLNENRN